MNSLDTKGGRKNKLLKGQKTWGFLFTWETFSTQNSFKKLGLTYLYLEKNSIITFSKFNQWMHYLVWIFSMLWSLSPLVSSYSLARKSNFLSFLLDIIWVGPKPFQRPFLIGVPFTSTLTNYTTPLFVSYIQWYFVSVNIWFRPWLK